MMRQTAALQVSVDFGPQPLETWRLLNAAAPVLLAVFANSPVYEGRCTGHRSFRANVWRELDGGRTGLMPCAGDDVGEYLSFALSAPAILLGPGDGCWPSFAEWNARGQATLQDWHTHLTTLFPEVRPKGFAEVRSLDAVPPEWYAAPLVLLAGIAYDAKASADARALLGAPDAGRLRRAGRDGLRDPEIASLATDLWEIALAGARALGPRYAPEWAIDEARAFRDAYTARARSPADDLEAAWETDAALAATSAG
jgi:glutamate--cysteine ligase